MLEVIKEYGGAGSMTHFPNMLKKEIKSMGTDLAKAMSNQFEQAKKTVRDKFLAALMLSGANGAKYNNLKRNMKENFETGTSRYPESPKAVLRILNAYQPTAGWNRRKQDTRAGTEEGTMFTQAKGGDNSWKARINCHKCGKKGHIAQECPKNKEKEEEQMYANIEQDALTEEEDIDKGENIFVQHKERGVVNKNWVLLDSKSTVNQIANQAFLSNIRKAKSQQPSTAMQDGLTAVSKENLEC
jgi:hypothetical protein